MKYSLGDHNQAPLQSENYTILFSGDVVPGDVHPDGSNSGGQSPASSNEEIRPVDEAKDDIQPNDFEASMAEVIPAGSVCRFCNKDFEGQTLQKISVYPICDDCKANLDQQIFPLWVKAFFVGILALVIFSVVWNWRFFDGYLNLKQSVKAFSEGRSSDAARIAAKVHDDVPEAADLQNLYYYYNGYDQLTKDHSAQALAEFNKIDSVMPAEFRLDELKLQARAGAAFDNKNYADFLAASKQIKALDAENAAAVLEVASAYSCLYAQNGTDSAKQGAIRYMADAKSKSKDTSNDDYFQLINYRLDTKQMLTRQQFKQKFPHGYNPSK